MKKTSEMPYLVRCRYNKLPVIFKELAVRLVCSFFYDTPVEIAREILKDVNPCLCYSKLSHIVKFSPVDFSDFSDRLVSYLISF